MNIDKLPNPGSFGSSADLSRAVLKAINSVELNHMYNGRRDTVPTPQVVDLLNYFKEAAKHLEDLLPKEKTKKGGKNAND